MILKELAIILCAMLLSNVTNYRRLFRHLRRSFAGTSGTHFRLTGKRLRTLAVFLVAFPVMHLAALLGFLLDDVLFPEYRKVPVDRPIFILGNFRSGSTFLHRLLALDEAMFSSFRTWEIYLAPSISQRKFFRGVLLVDRLFGRPLRRAIIRRESAVFEKVELHRVGLNDAEEDEGIFLYMWAGLFVWFFFPVPPSEIPFIHFERDVSPNEKRKMMRFYIECVRRHLYADHAPAGRFRQGRRGIRHVTTLAGGRPRATGDPKPERVAIPDSAVGRPDRVLRPRVFLSKNPSFSPKLPTLLRAFPDARFIYLARDPSAMVPSEIAWLAFTWGYFSSPREPYPFVESICDMAGHWFDSPLRILERLPREQRIILRFEDLVIHPDRAVREIYSRFGLNLTDDAARRMATAARRPRETSTNRQSASRVGLDRSTLAARFGDIMARFGYAATESKTVSQR